MKRLLADRYELRERIGRGAMGEVWSAIDLVSGSDVAVKLARGRVAAASLAELGARFEQEGRLLQRLRSPFICGLLARGRTEDDIPYLVLERLRGETLHDLLEREGTLSLEEAARIASSVLEALVVAHGIGIIHRDLSDTNIYMHNTHNGESTVKVLDFGVAKDMGGTAIATGRKVTLGSLGFSAPEQLGDASRAGPRADLYAVGTVVFRVLSGRMPFGDATGISLVALKREHDPPSIDEATGERWPAAIRTFLAKTTARLPSKRYESAAVALASLRAAAAIRGETPKLAAPEPLPDWPSTITYSRPQKT